MKKDKDESLSLIATGSSGGTFDRGDGKSDYVILY
jgi:hypothetical protein